MEKGRRNKQKPNKHTNNNKKMPHSGIITKYHHAAHELESESQRDGTQTEKKAEVMVCISGKVEVKHVKGCSSQ